MSIAAALPRDYSLVGRDSRRAEELGLASAEWYKAPIARKRLKELMQRNDEAAIRDTILWIAAFLVTGGLAVYFWPSWWCAALLPRLWRALRLVERFALA